MKSTIKDTKGFTSALADIRSTGRDLRTCANNVVLYGLEHFAKSGSCCYLDRAYKACIGEAKLDTEQMLYFIRKHANVEILDKGKKTARFAKKVGKDGKKQPAEYTEPSVAWFNFVRPESEKGEQLRDTDKWLANAIKKLADDIEAGKVKDVRHAKVTLKGMQQVFSVLTGK